MVPLWPVAPSPLCLLRGQVRRTDKLSPLEYCAYIEDIQEITLGQCDWDYIIITTMNDLIQHYPDEILSIRRGMGFRLPRIRSEPNFRRMTETILTARKLLTVSIDPEFRIPPTFGISFIENFAPDIWRELSFAFETPSTRA